MIKLMLAVSVDFFRRCWYLAFYRGNLYSCSFCGRSFRKFLPAGLKFQVLKEKKVVGGGFRFNAVCPFCGSGDRERLVHLLIKKDDLLTADMTLLHVAPEKNLQKFLEKSGINYFSADLKSSRARLRMDIRNIDFASDYFDAVICNHVLEHIVDDRKAMKELFRVLKPGCWAILQVPFSPVLKKTLEDSSIVSPKERERAFGQSDHVRIYGVDYVDRLESVGFRVERKKLDDSIIKKFALIPEEKVFFCRK